ncbi:hypothetical protein GCM10011414_04420 [Croceivirga lutea]|nr:hypothetical protein GCM10011414_04420 [Croceivirga lutea]
MFLKEVLSALTSKFSSFENLNFILPSNRSIREFKSLIASEKNAPVFAPKCYTIEAFTTKISGLQLTDATYLQLKLFEVYKNLDDKNLDDFKIFSTWANSVLGDFNEIDRYLINPQDIFNYLSEISSIKNWNPNQEPTSLLNRYINFTKSLETLYYKLNEVLLKENLGYQGMRYRKASENCEQFLNAHHNENFIFVGLNALNKAELEMLKVFLQKEKNSIYWDLDNYFFTDNYHDAGYFMRSNLNQFTNHQKQIYRLSNDTFLKKDIIKITGVPKNIGQTKTIGEEIEKLSSANTSTAIVLADESLLAPILNALPESVFDSINITMGLPITTSNSSKLVMSLFKLVNSDLEKGLYYADIQKLAYNPILEFLVQPTKLRAFIKKLKSNNEVLVTKVHLIALFENHQSLLQLITNKIIPTEILPQFSEILVKIYASEIPNKIEKESLKLILKRFSELQKMLLQSKHTFNLTDVELLVNNALQELSISFKSDPTSRIQIMGLLETRALDFDNVVISSVNEGVLPAGKSDNSYIPYDVKQEFGLPTTKEKDAVYTYHFYRLLQRAKKIHLIYNTEPDVLKGGEPSRFIYQITTDSNLSQLLERNYLSQEITPQVSGLKSILKTKSLITSLSELAQTGYSPSSLSSYIRDPFTFYKQHILKIESPDTIDVDVAYNVLGTIIHDSLEKLYLPLIAKELTQSHFKALEPLVEEYVFTEFEKYYPKTAILKGKNFILFNVIIKYVHSVILQDIATLKLGALKIISLEKKLRSKFTLPNGDSFVLKGKLDRIDVFEGQTRVIDYKTGSVESSSLKLNDMKLIASENKYDKAFQLLCYSLLYKKETGKIPHSAFILPIKQIHKGLLPVTYNKSSLITTELIEEFTKELYGLVLELHNPEIPFLEKEI